MAFVGYSIILAYSHKLTLELLRTLPILTILYIWLSIRLSRTVCENYLFRVLELTFTPSRKYIQTPCLLRPFRDSPCNI